MSAARVGGIVLAAMALLAMAWASDRSWSASPAEVAVLRVSLGARPERIEVCQEQSNEELAKVAPQMRQRLVCEGASARYRIELTRDGRQLLVDTLRGGGMRHDRPLYVFREFAVPAGSARYSMQLTRLDTMPAAGGGPAATESDTALIGERALRDVDQRRRQKESALPSALAIGLDASLRDREVLLFTYDAETRALKVIRSDPR